jgi:hypothetical protein
MDTEVHLPSALLGFGLLCSHPFFLCIYFSLWDGYAYSVPLFIGNMELAF